MSAMRKSRIELLTSKFENHWMEENEIIGQYQAKMSDKSNESFILGEKIPKKKLIWKALRTLPKRCACMVVAIR